MRPTLFVSSQVNHAVSPPQMIVVPIDFSPMSVHAVQTAIELPGASGDVSLIHVIPSLSPVSPLGVFGDEDVEAQMISKAEAFLTNWVEDNGLLGVQTSVQTGHAAQQIVEHAESQAANLIVIPSRGQSGLERALMGSVAARVIWRAGCATLVMRG